MGQKFKTFKLKAISSRASVLFFSDSVLLTSFLGVVDYIEKMLTDLTCVHKVLRAGPPFSNKSITLLLDNPWSQMLTGGGLLLLQAKTAQFLLALAEYPHLEFFLDRLTDDHIIEIATGVTISVLRSLLESPRFQKRLNVKLLMRLPHPKVLIANDKAFSLLGIENTLKLALETRGGFLVCEALLARKDALGQLTSEHLFKLAEVLSTIALSLLQNESLIPKWQYHHLVKLGKKYGSWCGEELPSLIKKRQLEFLLRLPVDELLILAMEDPQTALLCFQKQELLQKWQYEHLIKLKQKYNNFEKVITYDTRRSINKLINEQIALCPFLQDHRFQKDNVHAKTLLKPDAAQKIEKPTAKSTFTSKRKIDIPSSLTTQDPTQSFNWKIAVGILLVVLGILGLSLTLTGIGGLVGTPLAVTALTGLNFLGWSLTTTSIVTLLAGEIGFGVGATVGTALVGHHIHSPKDNSLLPHQCSKKVVASTYAGFYHRTGQNQFETNSVAKNKIIKAKSGSIDHHEPLYSSPKKNPINTIAHRPPRTHRNASF